MIRGPVVAESGACAVQPRPPAHGVRYVATGASCVWPPTTTVRYSRAERPTMFLLLNRLNASTMSSTSTGPIGMCRDPRIEGRRAGQALRVARGAGRTVVAVVAVVAVVVQIAVD